MTADREFERWECPVHGDHTTVTLPLGDDLEGTTTRACCARERVRVVYVGRVCTCLSDQRSVCRAHPFGRCTSVDTSAPKSSLAEFNVIAASEGRNPWAKDGSE